MNRALTATLIALCTSSYIALPVLADGIAGDATSSATVAGVANGTDAGSESAKTVDTDKKAIAENDPAATTPAATDPKKDPAAKGSKSGGNVNIATRMASFTTGIVVGTPICILRRTHLEIKQGEHDLFGDEDTILKKTLFVFPGLLMAVPFGGVSGGLGGAAFAVKNAWAGSKDEPFGKTSFSLGDIGN
jgi:hypothetical protein